MYIFEHHLAGYLPLNDNPYNFIYLRAFNESFVKKINLQTENPSWKIFARINFRKLAFDIQIFATTFRTILGKIEKNREKISPREN